MCYIWNLRTGETKSRADWHFPAPQLWSAGPQILQRWTECAKEAGRPSLPSDKLPTHICFQLRLLENTVSFGKMGRRLLRNHGPAGNEQRLQTTLPTAKLAVVLGPSQLEKVAPGPWACRTQAQMPCLSSSMSILVPLGHLWIGKWHSPIRAKDH